MLIYILNNFTFQTFVTHNTEVTWCYLTSVTLIHTIPKIKFSINKQVHTEKNTLWKISGIFTKNY